MQRTLLRLTISCIPLLLGGATQLGCGGSSCEDTATCNVGNGDGGTGTGTAVGGSGPGAGGSGAGAGGSGGAGTGTGTGTSTGTATGMQPDNTPPTIESFTPSDGADGVTDDTPLVITFSEPMNKPDTEGAFASSDMGAVTFQWTDDHILEVTGADVSYAAGDASVMANLYSWMIDTGAKDLAGNALLEEETGSFSTLREITTQPPLLDQQSVNSSGSIANCTVQGGGKFIGDRSQTRCRVLLDYDLSSVPASADVTDASINCARKSVTGTPFTDLGPIVLHHVSYDPNDLAAGFGAAPIGQSASAFFNASQATMNVALTSAVATQAMASDTTLQLRLDFDQSPITVAVVDRYVFFHSPNDSPAHGCDPDSLSVTYLAP